jgi:hypothetical protein
MEPIEDAQVLPFVSSGPTPCLGHLGVDDITEGDCYEAAQAIELQMSGEGARRDRDGEILPGTQAMIQAVRQANWQRTLPALAALESFVQILGQEEDHDFTDSETLIIHSTDLITSLLHLLTLRRLVPSVVVEDAWRHFNAENVGAA